MQPAGGRRDHRIQALRGVAVLLVVLLHAFKMVDRACRGPGAVTDLFPNDEFGAMGVDLFFVISGAVMAGVIDRRPTAAAFLRDRAIRLLPMWWLAAGAALALWNIFPIAGERDGLVNTATLIPLFDRGVYDAPTPAVGWTLGFEAVFYLLVATALALPGAAGRWLPIAALAVLGGAGPVLRPRLPLAAFCCNALLLEFLLGMLAMRAARTAMARTAAPVLVAAALVLLAVPVVLGFDFHTDPRTALDGINGLQRVLLWGGPCALLLLGLTARPDRGTHAGGLVRLGDASYSIYLTHTLFTTASLYLWRWWGPVGRDLLIVLLVAAGLAAGFAVHRRIERPLLARLRRRYASAAASANTVSPRSFTSANPPSTRMRAATLLAPE